MLWPWTHHCAECTNHLIFISVGLLREELPLPTFHKQGDKGLCLKCNFYRPFLAVHVNTVPHYKKLFREDFPGGPVVRILCFHYGRSWFDPWSGNWNPISHAVWSKKRKARVKLIHKNTYQNYEKWAVNLLSSFPQTKAKREIQADKKLSPLV